MILRLFFQQSSCPKEGSIFQENTTIIDLRSDTVIAIICKELNVYGKDTYDTNCRCCSRLLDEEECLTKMWKIEIVGGNQRCTHKCGIDRSSVINLCIRHKRSGEISTERFI